VDDRACIFRTWQLSAHNAWPAEEEALQLVRRFIYKTRALCFRLHPLDDHFHSKSFPKRQSAVDDDFSYRVVFEGGDEAAVYLQLLKMVASEVGH
jgi:hypothetical protein